LAVLRDGKVFVAGGEYSGATSTADLLAAEIFDPQANTWTSLQTPPGWRHLGDASSCVLPDGTILVGSIDDNRTAIFDPGALVWRASASKLNKTSNEEKWTLLPDGTIVTLDFFGHPRAEKYLIAQDSWIWAGQTPSDLVEDASKGIGPALLLPDGRVFAIGATGHTAFYTLPSNPAEPGIWTDGPTFAPQAAGQTLGAKDAPACLHPNGKVLCAVGPVDGQAKDYLRPTFFFELDPASGSVTLVASPGNSDQASFNGRMLLLPTGEVLFSNGSMDIEAYTPDLGPADTWRPVITGCPSQVQPGQTFVLQGRQLNGLSQAVSYGDDAQMATNYPIIRIRNLASNHVGYCRTFGHSTMGVATGQTVHSTNVSVPASIEFGPSELEVVANGISSGAFTVNDSPAT
jgi:hypothetical protein